MAVSEQRAVAGPSGEVLRALRRGLGTFALMRESPVGVVGALLVLFWVIVAILAPALAPFGPTETILPFAKPGAAAPGGGSFILGTDTLGRDVLSRIIWGSRTVLLYAPLATFVAYVVGIAMGVSAAYFRGFTDTALSFISNVILSFPVMVLYVLIITTFGPSGINVVLAVIFASAPAIMRIVRGLVLDLRAREYVAAAQTRGESAWYIMLIEILPNARGPLIVDACLRMGYVTIIIGVLGFLGLGLPPPTPDWGGMVSDARAVATVFPHMAVFPCLAITSLVLGLNLLADGLRDISMRD